MKKSFKQIKLEQIRMRNRQNPSKNDLKVRKRKSKLKHEYWSRVKNISE